MITHKKDQQNMAFFLEANRGMADDMLLPSMLPGFLGFDIPVAAKTYRKRLFFHQRHTATLAISNTINSEDISSFSCAILSAWKQRVFCFRCCVHIASAPRLSWGLSLLWSWNPPQPGHDGLTFLSHDLRGVDACLWCNVIVVVISCHVLVTLDHFSHKFIEF